MATKVVIYGLSTEGYSLACQIALNGGDVQIIDESTPSAISIKQDIAKSYPSVQALKDDEPLLAMTSIDAAISKAQVLIFAPRIRKTGQDIKIEINSKFKDAVSNIKKGCNVVYGLGTGFGGNSENISLLEHVTGLKVGKNVSYFYYPLSKETTIKSYIGSSNSKENDVLKKLFTNDKNFNFLSLSSSEYFHAIDILKQFSSQTSILEVCKFAKDSVTKSDLNSEKLGELFLDDLIDGLFDLRSLSSSFEGASSLMYLINGSMKGLDGYIKRLIDETRLILKKNELKASRTKILLLWSLDQHEMKGEKIEKLQELETKLKDYIGDVESISQPVDIFQNEKTTIVVVCSKHDFDYMMKNNKDDELIILKANPLCQLISQK
jgi:PHD/YefM family antitoxin component YafN of YafNO toxin-antitoxin module